MTSSAEGAETPRPEAAPHQRDRPSGVGISPVGAVTFEYDLFVVHAAADELFVRGTCCPPSAWRPSA